MRTHVTKLGIAIVTALFALAGCGEKQEFDRGEELEPAVLGGGGASRSAGVAQSIVQPGAPAPAPAPALQPVVVKVTTQVLKKVESTCKVQKTRQKLKAKPVFQLHNVTNIIPATGGLPDYAPSDFPFTGTPNDIGIDIPDRLTPFHFTFDYPENNFQLSEARVVVDTKRDNSDTEGIFVDGVLSGRPPAGNVNRASPKITDFVDIHSAAADKNTYFIDFALTHYKKLVQNTFDLALPDLLRYTDKTPAGVLSDGRLEVITGDDSPVYQAYLVIKGLTMTPQGQALECTQSAPYTFTNVYVHNDGNTIGEPSLSGSLGTPFTAWAPVMGTYAGIEFNYDSVLPKVRVEDVTILNAKLAMTVRKAAAVAPALTPAPAAIIVNGVGVASTDFDKTQATAVVESWVDAGTADFDTFLASVPTTAGGAVRELDLVLLLGATKVRELLAQGKFNVTIAGNLTAQANRASADRTFGLTSDGPELKMNGEYITELCEIPANAASPLTQSGIVAIPDEYEDVVEEVDEKCYVDTLVDEESEVTVEQEVEPTPDETSSDDEDEVLVLNDGAGPVLSSVQASEITANSATIYWLTDENATSQVAYGIGSPSAQTAKDPALATFHQVHLTGLSPYKYYNFQVISEDKYGNVTTSVITVFVTLR